MRSPLRGASLLLLLGSLATRDASATDWVVEPTGTPFTGLFTCARARTLGIHVASPQDAVNCLLSEGADGDRILLRPGLHHGFAALGAVVSLPHNIRVQPEVPGSVVAIDSPPALGDLGAPLVILQRTDGWVLEGLELRSAGTVPDANPRVSALLGEVRNSLVHNCTFNGGLAVLVSAGSIGVEVSDSRFNGVWGVGIAIATEAAVSTAARNVAVLRNTIAGVLPTTLDALYQPLAAGIAAGQVDGLEVLNNALLGVRGVGIYLGAPAGATLTGVRRVLHNTVVTADAERTAGDHAAAIVTRAAVGSFANNILLAQGANTVLTTTAEATFGPNALGNNLVSADAAGTRFWLSPAGLRGFAQYQSAAGDSTSRSVARVGLVDETRGLLVAGSPAIDRARLSSPLVLDDFLLHPRDSTPDIGCHEFPVVRLDAGPEASVDAAPDATPEASLEASIFKEAGSLPTEDSGPEAGPAADVTAEPSSPATPPGRAFASGACACRSVPGAPLGAPRGLLGLGLGALALRRRRRA